MKGVVGADGCVMCSGIWVAQRACDMDADILVILCWTHGGEGKDGVAIFSLYFCLGDVPYVVCFYKERHAMAEMSHVKIEG